MPCIWFETVARALAMERSRRRALGLIVAAAVVARWSGESTARKKKKHRKNEESPGGGCTVRHSEKQILDFIDKAARKYGQSKSAMERVARCESSLDPCAVNHSGPYYGLFQFLKSTWKSTPYGDQDIYDPEAQALATAWMWNEGRKNEWACQ